QSEQIFRRRDGDSALALDRLNQDRGSLRRNRGAHRFEIVERNLFESFNRGFESFFYFFLTGRGDSGQRSTMKRAGGGDDFVAAIRMSEFPRKFEEALVRFRSAVAKEYSPR